ncbi:MAG: RNA-directed DNA polymerase [Bacilli bacterium]|nr:RNA-directed DNA polymerase [Bacilli bacterium]
MKTEEIFTFENLYEAYKMCRKSKQHKGEVIRFEINLSYNISILMKELYTKKYKLGKYKKFLIHEPKERLIESLPFKDRVVIRCFCDQVLKKKIEPKLIYDNTACRKEKGTDFAIKRLEKFLRHEYLLENNNNIYFLKADIRKYFPSIDHKILLNILEKINFSEDEMWMIRKLILEQPDNNKKGLPLGNQSSQWFALLYLNTIDRYIKEKLRIKAYVRYMDDMILIHRDKKYLKECLQKIEEICNSKLNLELNDKTQISMVKNGIDFLGYRHILNEKGKIIRKLRASSKVRMKRHVKTLGKLKRKNIVDNDYVLIRKNAFYNHIKDTNESRRFKNKIANIEQNI